MLKEDKEMQKLYNEIYEDIKPNQDLINSTLKLMKRESKKERKSCLYSFKNKQKPITALACLLLLFIGINLYNKKHINSFSPPQNSEIKNEFSSPQLDETTQTVNVSGVIEEVDHNNSKIKISDKWIVIDENTRFSFKDDGTEVSRHFEVGNHVEGFTTDSTDLPEVKASYIYLNE